MRSLLTFVLFAVAGVFVSVAAHAGLVAQPSSVLFYPGEAQLNVEEKIAPAALEDGLRFSLTIPFAASEDSFSVSVPGNQISGVAWKEEDEMAFLAGNARDYAENDQAPALRQQANAGSWLRPILPADPQREPSPERRALLVEYFKARRDYEGIISASRAVEERLAMWQRETTRKVALSADETLKLDKIMGDQLPKLLAESQRLELLLGESAYILGKIDKKLREYDEKHRTRTVVVTLRNRAQEAITAKYSYVVQAGFSSAYRINATPAANAVRIDQQATLTQYTGQNWENVDVMLSTARRDSRLNPNQINPWRIALQSKEDTRARSAPAPTAKMADMAYEAAAPASGAAPAPYYEERSTFRIWNLGKRSIESDIPLLVDLASDEYKAEFYYTLRPSADSKGFLTARLDLATPVELPEGQAQLLVDDIAIGRRSISLSGNEATLFFGQDPQITVTSRAVDSTSGSQGFISKEQTLSQQWEIVAKNTRNRDVAVRIEEPRPFVTDQEIKVELDSKPAPEQARDKLSTAENTFVWKTVLKPGEEYKISHKVFITAPQDKVLVNGRR